jgi:hypothetical protein
MNKNKFFSTLIVSILCITGIYGYYKNISAMKGDGAVSSMRGALTYVEANWQDGDIIFTTDDGPWINLTPYTDKPIYRMPTCQEKGSYAPVLGSLSTQTRDALGMQVADLTDIPHQRAWVFAPTRSPLHPECYITQIAPLTETPPVYVVDDNEWLFSGVWLVMK